MARRMCYQVAASLDGYIAAEDGGYDWIVADPEIDFAALFARFDTLVMGRKTYEVTMSDGGPDLGDKAVYVVSRTLDPAAHPDVMVIGENIEETVAALRRQDGKDIWLFGGGELFRTLLEADLVDTVEIAVIPVLLGGGVPVLAPPAPRASLHLTGHRVYGSGIVLLEYEVASEPSDAQAR